MIELPVDESYAIDFYSILVVKLEFANNKQEKSRASKTLQFYNNYLRERLGDTKFNAVINSIEYKKLEDANRDIFRLVENCYNYEVNMRVSAEMNIIRWKLKDKLQKKFFSRAASEQKLGNFVNPD